MNEERRRDAWDDDSVPVEMRDRAGRRTKRDWREFVIERLDPVEAVARWWNWRR
jgi:hypothetical protein